MSANNSQKASEQPTAAYSADRPLSAWFHEPRLYVLTYKLPWKRWLPIPIRHTYEKVCTWDEAIAQQSKMRAMGLADCEVRLG